MNRSLKKGRARRARFKRRRRFRLRLGSIVPLVLRSMVFDPFAAMLRDQLLASMRVPGHLLGFVHAGVRGDRTSTYQEGVRMFDEKTGKLRHPEPGELDPPANLGRGGA